MTTRESAWRSDHAAGGVCDASARAPWAGNHQLRERQRAVTDPPGGRAGAQVTARQTETNLTGEAATDGEGRFRFPYLKVGPYEITVRQAGFADATRQLTLTVGAAFELPVSLTVGALDDERHRHRARPSCSRRRAARSPARSRRPRSGTCRSTGATSSTWRSWCRACRRPTSAARSSLPRRRRWPASGISVGSQRNFSNNFIVDGLSANDDAAGLSGIPYGVDAVDQFQVVTSGGQAELGRALGGYINVVTKSGTNAAHGDVYDYVRDDRFNAPNALRSTLHIPTAPSFR